MQTNAALAGEAEKTAALSQFSGAGGKRVSQKGHEEGPPSKVRPNRRKAHWLVAFTLAMAGLVAFPATDPNLTCEKLKSWSVDSRVRAQEATLDDADLLDGVEGLEVEAPAEEEQEEEIEPEEEIDEYEAVLELVLNSECKKKLREKKRPLNRADALKLYATWADEAGVDVVPFGTSVRSALGPFRFYGIMPDFQAILESKGNATVTFNIEKYEAKIMGDISITFIDEKAPSHKTSATGKAATVGSAHVIAYLDTPSQFKHVKAWQIKKFFQARGFIVCRASRQDVGGTETEQIHVNVVPRDSSTKEAAWPTQIMLEIQTHRRNEKKTPFYIGYALAESDELKADAFCARVRRRHGEQQARGDGWWRCAIFRRDRVGMGVGFDGRRTLRLNGAPIASSDASMSMASLCARW